MVTVSGRAFRRLTSFGAIFLATLCGVAGAAAAAPCTDGWMSLAGKPVVVPTTASASAACFFRRGLLTGAVLRQGSIGTPALLLVDAPGHSAIELDGDRLPEVTLTAMPDGVTGWNLRATLVNFALAPQNASTPHVPGQGHMHLYVDGTKITRLYGEWFHLPELPAGQYNLMVTLSANDHSALLVDGEPIAGSVTITQPAPHGHGADMDKYHGDHGEMLMASAVDVPAATAPGVSLEIHPDPMAGYNVHIRPSRFTLAPENTSGDHGEGEGHIHLYVDGEKVARVYSEWFHLPALADGEHEIRAVPFTNDHRAYTADGAAIEASAVIVVDTQNATAAHH